jgi:hypothetical protein
MLPLSPGLVLNPAAGPDPKPCGPESAVHDLMDLAHDGCGSGPDMDCVAGACGPVEKAGLLLRPGAAVLLGTAVPAAAVPAAVVPAVIVPAAVVPLPAAPPDSAVARRVGSGPVGKGSTSGSSMSASGPAAAAAAAAAASYMESAAA